MGHRILRIKSGDWKDCVVGDNDGKSPVRSLRVDTDVGRPVPGAPGPGAGAPAARALLVGARTARVTMEARLGPPAEGRAGGTDCEGSGGNAGVMPDFVDEAWDEELDDDTACACCSASTLGGGWKFGVGRGRTLFGR